MSKETFYFSHDYNARSDIKIRDLIVDHGMLGYGVFWSIIEDLYNNANALPLKYKTIAYDLRVDESVVKSIINDFELFDIQDEFFGSVSVQRRLDERSTKSNNARKSALYRWEKNKKNTNASKENANALQSESDTNAIKESKVKESKVKDILLKKETKEIFKNEIEIDSHLKIPEEEKTKKVALKKVIVSGEELTREEAFLKWWDLYDKKTDTKKAKDKFFKLSDLDIVLAIEKTPKYIFTTPDKKYRKNAITWLNGQCWHDEVDLIIQNNQNNQSNGFKTDSPGVKRQYQYDHERAMQALNGTIK